MVFKNKKEDDVVDKAVKKVEKEIDTAKKELKKEVLLNVPNSITLSRLILSFVFVYILFENYSRVLIFFVFTVAAITDWFDGYFARKLKQTSKFGARMDQIIDRVFTVVIVGSLVIYLMTHGTTSYDNIFRLAPDNVYLLLFLCCSREIIGFPGLFIALIRRKPTYNVKYIGKLTTFVQAFALGAVILELPWAIYLAIATGILGILAAFDYLRYSLS